MTTKDPETTYVDPSTDSVACDGGGALGHPRVWYSFDGKDEITCGYCDRVFSKAKKKKAAKKSGKAA